MRSIPSAVTALVLILLAQVASAETKPDENLFGSIRLDGKKIGNVHYTVSYDEQGVIDELRSHASYSVLGLQLYHFSQDLYERWSGGELQSFVGDTNDDGTRFYGELTRKPEHYEVVLNGKPLQLPHDAFPASVWQYRITEQHLLFSLSEFKLMKVQVSERSETIRIDGKPLDTRRFDFTGEWKATLWFDRDKQVVQFQYPVEGREVLVTLDRD